MGDLVPFSDFCGPSYRSQSILADCELTMNLIPEIIESRGSRPRDPALALNSVPGVSALNGFSSPASPCRGTFQQDGRAFAVFGYIVYEVTSVGMTQIGLVDMDARPAYFASGGDGAAGAIIMTSAGKVYTFSTLTTPASGFAQVVMPNSALGHFCGYLDGRFLILDASTSTLWISDVFAPTFNATMFRQRTLAPDRWVSMVVTRSAIFLLGSQSYEVWGVTGDYPIPYAPISGALFPVGCYAADSARAMGDSVIWVSGDSDGIGEVMLTEQYAPIPINDFAVAYKIQQAVEDGIDLSDAIGMTYQEIAHNFYNLTFIAADFTITYDLSTKMWHDRGFWDHTNAVFNAWRPLYHMYAFGKHLVGDRSSGNLYEMGVNFNTDVDGAMIRRVRRAPHVISALRNVFYNELRLDIQTGLGSLSGQGSDPKVMLRYSDDGSQTWSNGILASIGQRGKYATDVWFSQLGMARDRVFEIVITDPVPVRIVGAFIDFTLGTF